MSAQEDYLDTYDPDGHVLRFWFRKYHCEATIEDNRSTKATQRTVSNSISALDRFLAYRSGSYNCHWTDINEDEISYNNLSPRPRNLSPDIAEEFLVEIRKNYSGDHQQTIFTILKQAYSWCDDTVEPVEVNPFQQVEKKYKHTENDWILEPRHDRTPHIISLEEAREFVRNLDELSIICAQLILGKYPRRIGGVSNLDFVDVNLNHPGCNWTVHPMLRRWPDHILFRADKNQSEPTRKSGNKTKTDALYPIDEELKNFLIAYLTTRPQPDQDSNRPEPLFIGSKGARPGGYVFTQNIIANAKELGHYYEPSDDDNINGHYWRHWGTSWYEDQFGGNQDTAGYTTLTDYLRGDSRKEIKGLYNNYTDRKEARILDAMPTFFEPFVEDDD